MNALEVDAAYEPPEDRCTYRRPFAPGFSACPAFEPAPFPAVSSLNESLGMDATCRHLVMGSRSLASGRFYAACSLGDAEARLRWAARGSRSEPREAG